MNDSLGGGVIGDVGCRWFGLAKANETASEGDGFTCIHIEATNSVSAVEDMIFLMMWAITRIGALNWVWLAEPRK